MPYIISAIVAVLVVIGAGFGLNKYYTHTPEPTGFDIEVVETPDTAEAIPDVKSVSEKIAEKTKTTPKPTTTRAPVVTRTPTPTPTASVIIAGAPVISAVRISSITSSGATISWTTNIAADTQVEYGQLTSYCSATVLNAEKSTSHSVQLTGLTLNSTYHVRMRSRNAAGALGLSSDYSFDTLSGTATSADEIPEITDIIVDNLTTSSARIRWETDIDADGKVEYGKTTSYASSTSLNSSEVTSHTFTLSNLQADTTYHYRVRSKTSATTEEISGDRTFRTAVAATVDTTPPQISGINVTNITQTSVRVQWNTSEASDEAVEWGASSSYGAVTSNANSGVTTHSVYIGGLGAGEVYHYRVRSIDAAGNTGRSGDLTFTTESAPIQGTPDPDVTAPQISSVTMNPTPTTIVADWVTNEASDTTLYYKHISSQDPFASVTSANMTLNHHIVAPGIVSNETYLVYVSSKDAVGNTTNSVEQAVDIPLDPSPTP